MSDGDTVQLARLVVGLVLVGSALLARRLPLGQSVKMLLAWAAILFVGVLIVGAARETGGWDRLKGLMSDDEQLVTGSIVRLRMAEDGHFWANSTINGVPRRLLIDSGATTTSLSLATAQAARLDLEQSSIPTTVSTANGMVFARTSSVAELDVGPITARDLRVVVAPEFGETDVLGMNFLSRLASWRVEKDMLVLEPKP